MDVSRGENRKKSKSKRKNRKKSKPRRRKNSEGDWRPWADLPEEILDIISSNLSIAECLSLVGVCRSWRSFYSEYKHRFMASKLPLAVHISTRDKNSCSFLGMATGITYKIKLPEYFQNFNFFIGVSSGYLIMKNSSHNYLLINPITGHQLRFSRSPKLADSNIEYCRDRAIFASLGSQDQDFVLAVLPATRSNVELYTSRDNQWKDYSYRGKHELILDMVVFNGSIYVVTADSQIGKLNVRSPDVKFLNLKSAPCSLYLARLVTTNTQLLIVVWPQIKVYRIDFLKMEWVWVNNLGDQALFVDPCYKACFKLINPTKWGGQSNCVYELSFKGCWMYPLNGAQQKTWIWDWIWNCNIGYYLGSIVYSWYFVDQSNTIENIRDE